MTNPARPPITTLEELQTHLWEACFVEMSTIPLYLYGLYSIKSQIEGGTAGYVGGINMASSASAVPTLSAYRTIRSVVIEEMLHLTLARNVYVSIGGKKQFYDENFVPKYGVWDGKQQYMLHRLPPLEFNLVKCTKEQLKDTFMALESPAPKDAPPQSDWYNSIGQFYEAIEDGFRNVQSAIGEEQLFENSRVAYQLHSVASYWNQAGGGAPIGVTNIETAYAAMNEIIVQGEGANQGDDAPITFGESTQGVRDYEFSHFEKFQRIYEGIDSVGPMSDWDDNLWPLMTNPRLKYFEHDPKLRALGEFFNACYGYSLILIDANYTVPLPDLVVQGGDLTPEQWAAVRKDPNMKKKWGLTQALLTTMTGILFPVIDIIVRQKRSPKGSEHAGPTFEFYQFPTEPDPKAHLLSLCDALVPDYPALSGADSVRQRIADLPSVTPVMSPA